MSHSPALNLDPHPSDRMKKKILATFIAVVVGHIGVFWALGQMKIQELKPVHKQPLQVRFVKIQQPSKPLPPKPKEKPKPQEKPKEVKEVKIVEKQLPPPPKKVEKIQQVKTQAPKQAVEQPVVKAPPAPVVTTTKSAVTKPAQQSAPQPVAPQPSAPAADPSPKTVSIGGGSGVEWKYGTDRITRGLNEVVEDFLNSNTDDSLKGTFVIKLRIHATAKGTITDVEIIKSSGNSKLDQMVKRYISRQSFKPYTHDFIAPQPFALNLN
ncbi:TonB family protein [Acinetobacter sp. ANC 4635]|uniref:TonB family protein n=1 Tax=Acinetobacter sp. ANC 4635 TaxID=2529846 RepID=UPI001040A3E1|nr:TonB family protein [Acinetobacter sp. ANC 4635]TCB33184.1 TonB family protein [Acinetobacter sp. ANC 4635]